MASLLADLFLLVSEVLSYVPIVDRAIGVTSRQDLSISCSIAHIWLTVVDVVLMECLLRLHHSACFELGTIKEDSAASKGILADAGSLRAPVAWV